MPGSPRRTTGARERWGRLPTALASRATGVLARLPVPRPLRRPVLGTVARVLGMDLAEAADPIARYRSLDDLFVRRLRDGARSWPAEPGVPGSPVDGVIGQGGRIEEGRLLQAKGRGYAAADLLDDDALAARFEGGTFLTIYLAPRHYHRIHAPVGGAVGRARHVPGRLVPVNAPAVRRVDRLFPRNERLSALIEGDQATGLVAVVAVGAFNVGRISADFDPGLVTNRRGARAETHVYHPPVAVGRGDPLMAFHLGSTVVLLFERALALGPDVASGRDIRLGAPLGTPRGQARPAEPGT